MLARHSLLYHYKEQIMKKGVATAVVLACALVIGNRSVVAEETSTHLVKQGDTLWDLSDGYLHDPLLWPKIWKINPHIENPHLISPGQLVKIPRLGEAPASDRLPAGAAPLAVRSAVDLSALSPLPVKIATRETPVVVEESAAPDAFAQYYDRGIGSVTYDIPAGGEVLDTREGWQHAATGETVLVRAEGAQVGQQFGVYRDMGKVAALSYFGSSPGHLLADIAIIEIIASETEQQRAVVTRSFAELREGDLLGPLPQRPTVTARYAENGPRAVAGSVVAVHMLRDVAGPDDIVYVDLGADQGLAPGDRLFAQEAVDASERRNSAELVVLRVTPTTAAAVVTGKSAHAVRPGDKVGPVL